MWDTQTHTHTDTQTDRQTHTQTNAKNRPPTGTSRLSSTSYNVYSKVPLVRTGWVYKNSVRTNGLFVLTVVHPASVQIFVFLTVRPSDELFVRLNGFTFAVSFVLTDFKDIFPSIRRTICSSIVRLILTDSLSQDYYMD